MENSLALGMFMLSLMTFPSFAQIKNDINSLIDSLATRGKTIKLIPRDVPLVKDTIEVESAAWQLLRKVIATYKGLEGYHFEGAVRMEMHAEGMQQKFDTPFIIAWVKPSKIRVEVKSYMFGLYLVSDGQTTWQYIPSLKQYTKKSVAAIKTSIEETGTSLSSLQNAGAAMLTEYERITDRIKRARFLRDEAVEIGGKRIDCYVLEVEYLPTKGSAAPNMQITLKPHTYWIDKTRNIILRDSSGSTIPSPQFSGPIEMAQVKVFTFVEIYRPVADSLFVFTPPEGAKEVEELNIPGMKRANLSGKEAPDFALKDLEGKAVSVKSLRGKVVLLDFWASWCGPCRQELPHIEKLHTEYKEKGLVVLGVNDEDAQVALDFVKENRYSFPTLVDAQREVSKLFQVTAIPTVIVIDKEGKISTHYIGARSEADLRAALKKVGIE